MATIPMGNFGQAIARPAPQAGIPRLDAMGAAADRFSQVAGNVVADSAERGQRLQMQALAEERRKDEEVAAAAIRAKTITALTGTKDGLNDLHDEVSGGVLSGTVPKDKAESMFTERAGKLLTSLDTGLPEAQRGIVLAELNADVMRLGNAVRRSVTQRDRQDVSAGISQTLEHLQRSFRTDPAGSTQKAMGLIDQLGPQSNMTPEQLVKLKQSWKEGTQYTAAFEMVSSGRGNPAKLDEAERLITTGLPDLDPQKRASLLDRVSVERLRIDQKADQAAARAEREAERRLKRAEAEFTTFQTMADKGTALDPAYIDKALTVTAGTPFQAGVVELARTAREVGGLAAQPVAVQRAALDRVNAEIAQNGRTPALEKRRAQIEKVVRGSQEDVERDPLRAGLERGVITDLQPLDPRQGMPGVLQQLQARAEAVQRVSLWAGRQVSPMTEDEAATIKSQLDALPAKDRSAMVAALAQTVGPQGAQGLATQMDKKDKGLALAFAFAGAQTTMGRFTSELVLKGQQAKNDGTSTKGEKAPDVKPGQWSARIAAALDGVFPAQTLTDQTREAALLIAHGLAAEAGGLLRDRDLDRAIGFAVQGSVIERNGQKIVLPAGMDESALERRLESVTAADLTAQAPDGQVRAGGSPVPVAEFVKTLPGQKLMYAGPGRFVVIVGGRPVVNAAGRPIFIGVQ
jgi:hypothetical protein